MAELSYIIQNGNQINLKDAAAREMLNNKQNKLTAGNGIIISEDGTIRAELFPNASSKFRIMKIYTVFWDGAILLNSGDAWSDFNHELHTPEVYYYIYEDFFATLKTYIDNNKNLSITSGSQVIGYQDHAFGGNNYAAGYHIGFLNKETNKVSPYLKADKDLKNYKICLFFNDGLDWWPEDRGTDNNDYVYIITEICEASEANIDEEVYHGEE